MDFSSMSAFDSIVSAEDVIIKNNELIGATCVRGYLINLYQTPAGYVLGTEDENSHLNCCLCSPKATKEEALQINSITESAKIHCCNNGKGCIPVRRMI